MPRSATDQLGWGNHNKVVTGSQDGSKQVSKNEWNDSLDESGLFGFTKQAGTISGNAIVPTGSVIEVQADGTLNTLTTTNNNEFDLIYLIGKAGEDAITITHNASGGAGNIRLLSGASETLSTTTPMILMCRSISSVLEWSQYGGGIVNALDDIGDVVITGVGNEDVLAYDSTTSKWINQTADETGRVTASSTTTFTNKTIDQDGTGNSITNLANASIKASAGIAYSKLTLTGAVVSDDLAGSIANSKLATDPLSYANMTSPVASVAFNAQKLTGVADPALAQDVATKNYVDTNVSSVTASSTTTFTNKTIDADGTGNSITNIEDANIKASAAIDATKIANGTVTSAEFQYLGDVTSLVQAQIDGKSATAGNGSLVTVGALDSGSITSGFGTIDTGSSTITTTGAVATGAITAGGTITGNVTGALTGNADTVTTNADLTGDVTSSGNATTIATSAVDIAMLSATGTASGTTFLCGDNTWKVAGGDDTPWTVVHDFDTYYYDMQVQTKPADPSADNGRFYVKEVDTDNDGVFCIIRKNGAFEETQIV
jgi:hypothetical protein